MLIALMTATSCSETETEIDPTPDEGGSGQAVLGITTNLKVEASSKAQTKAVVSGTAITYSEANYTDADLAPGLGVVITNHDGKAWYTPDAAGAYTGHHVWYIGDAKGENWKSIKDDKSTSFAEAKEVPYFLTKEVGQVYAYYPYDKSYTPTTMSTDLKIPITILTEGAINATTNNAAMAWQSGSWKKNNNNAVNLSLATEKDYLYFDPEDRGRYVNNGRAAGTPFDPEGTIDNTKTDNPGYKIELTMKHAMAMVSFRVYDGGNLSDDAVSFTKFEIKNHSGSQLFKIGDAYMSLTDGTITDKNRSAGSISRTITDYTLMRQIKEGEEGNETNTFIETRTVTGQSVSKIVSAIVYPTTFGDNAIDVEITLNEGGSKGVVVYPVTLPGNAWDAGTHWIYTFSAGRNKLSLMSVSVVDWDVQEPDDIPL